MLQAAFQINKHGLNHVGMDKSYQNHVIIYNCTIRTQIIKSFSSILLTRILARVIFTTYCVSISRILPTNVFTNP